MNLMKENIVILNNYSSEVYANDRGLHYTA